jgi:hypothetical protein
LLAPVAKIIIGSSSWGNRLDDAREKQLTHCDERQARKGYPISMTIAHKERVGCEPD